MHSLPSSSSNIRGQIHFKQSSGMKLAFTDISQETGIVWRQWLFMLQFLLKQMSHCTLMKLADSMLCCINNSSIVMVVIILVAAPAYWDAGDDPAEMLHVEGRWSMGSCGLCAIRQHVSWSGNSVVWMVVPHDKKLVHHYPEEALESTEYAHIWCPRFLVYFMFILYLCI